MANICFNLKQLPTIDDGLREMLAENQADWDSIERVKDEEMYELIFRRSQCKESQ